MATDREKEREAELESAMYTNCLFLGLDPAVLGSPSSPAARVGLFRHSNPRLGEQLLYFLLSSLRGPAQSAKDFDKVWPIFDSAQSREFRKIVQGIISDLEQQGALPRSNSRVSSLATCCGPRFVELLWQLSVHALREVHRRMFAADVASNPLPVALTDVSYLHAAALLPVTKARIALERRKFLKNANIAVQRQNIWSNLAHEMTAEFRSLCAEEAYLQQELEKLQDMRNKAKLEGELWDERLSSLSGQNSHLVSKATRLWESILARKGCIRTGQHEVLASGPIEDLIAHREHRYRISGSQLLTAMDLSSSVPHSELLSARAGETSPFLEKQEQISLFQGKEEVLSRLDDRNGCAHQTIDVAEILRRWTHALQRIHKQSLHLAKANDGEGPELLRSASDGETSTHADSLTATLAEHRQHLVSIQGLINQLKEAIPTMQLSIAELSEEVNSLSSNPMDQLNSRLPLSVQNAGLGRPEESSSEVSEMTSKLSSTHLDKLGGSPALKLPPLFSLTPSSSGKGTQTQKQNALARHPSQEVTSEERTLALPSTKDQMNGSAHENDGYFAHDIKRSVRDAALSKPLRNTERSQDKTSDDGSEHFFIPLSTGASRNEIDAVTNQRKQRLSLSSPQTKFPKSMSDLYYTTDSPMNMSPILLSELNGHDPSSVICFLDPVSGLAHQSFITDDALDQAFSPLLMDSSLFHDADEDLLAPLSETDAALMEH
ncbi:AUGMIN subunit 6-like isoform X2 [Phragmites australis]|uniref:AUGMIN subunit 6-like isoform X2 n=1 Tax=Phragmites australis TaxID=29695 RepID=UPI002D79CC4C|nr:AUGMIN subunit 6-like isoform X2 [Phragmites australis]